MSFRIRSLLTVNGNLLIPSDDPNKFFKIICDCKKDEFVYIGDSITCKNCMKMITLEDEIEAQKNISN